MSTAPFLPFAGQRFAVVGLGRAGLPSARRLVEWGAEILCWDDGEAAREAARAAGLPVGDPSKVARFDFDALLLSPGIPHLLPRAHPAAAAAARTGVPVICDAELLFRAVRASGSAARFVGITGTNGKSTTTALIHHLLARAGHEVAVGGNLGPAALGLPLLGDSGIYVLEMSSYMLERMQSLRFDIAVQLNLSPDHLDRHGGMDGYAAAKMHVFDRQDRTSLAVVGMDDEWGAHFTAGRAGKATRISGTTRQPGGVWAEGRILRDDDGPIADLGIARALPGSHNAQNAAAAAAVALHFGLTREDIAAGIGGFPGLPHRQEAVGTISGIAFVNDSKATNADSTERALASYDRVVLIAGGVPKAGGIAPLAPLFPRIAHAVLIGEAAEDFAATLSAHGVSHEVAGTLEAAVPAALASARRSGTDVVLLSPACASFDQFSGFDARGDAFRAQVASMMETV
ncbi:UDP-N-acetylmuramoyl-L-alanine--D-glutamate ligase [Roseomonas marmotae]|uniref:UDP-N-acetylmuramoylalanine--D-glutamate ligase n=1 Tax=Roseomonas marmotae TaxID=2768161 RepID=A0ABS3KBF6_9PROT|nr:UDP-N-acetylmuramoyl-L-alanine--D-glutamate ligase [Roseomonas marmotae]MBO1074803.1 UDP-N-acetylmuramoyl-L-alanine--D-glutamate ligase [Roseomonas marmotae]QTI80688.1 UDP-N-acetylmuramoyl-L-alanine--D-glutamate ligase [Roseomonas marmotae]